MPADDDRVSELLERWDEGRRQGKPVSLDELCADEPDLRTEIETAIYKLGRLEALCTPVAARPDRFPTITGYEVLALVAHGGQAVVYKARHVRLKRLVALKMVIAGSLAGEAELDRFRREAEALARFQYPNIVQIHEIGEYEGRPFLALEFVDGGSLAANLAGTPQPALQAAERLLVLSRAMASAHSHQIIHRDLKPANVLLTGDGVLKITDFGLAKNLAGDDGLSRSGNVMGTPSYMAPEQARDGSNVGAAADIYSLGAIFYEMLTGRPPFRGANPLDTLDQLLHVEPVSPRQLQPKLPRDVEVICLKCLDKNPAKRYGNAIELAADLENFLHGRPIVARPISRWNRLRRWCVRNPVLAANVGFAITAVMVAVITLIVAVIQVSRSRDQAVNLADANERLAQQEQQQRQLAERERRRALREAAYSALERGRGLYKLGEGGRGLLWYARALELAAEADDAELQHAIVAHLSFAPRQTHLLRAVLPHPIGKSVRPRAALSLDGRYVLTAFADHRLRLWDAVSGELQGEPFEHPEPVLRIAFRPTGDAAWSVSDNGVVREWSTVEGRLRLRRVVCRGAVGNAPIVFNPKGDLVVTGGNGFRLSQLRDTATGEPFGGPLEHGHEVTGAAFTPDGRILLTASYEGLVRLWDVASIKAEARPKPIHVIDPAGRAWDVAVSPDGKRFVTATSEGFAQKWDIKTLDPIGPPMRHQGPVHALACSRDGLILTASHDGTARLWDADTGAMIGNPLTHQGTLWAAAFNGDGTTIITASADGTVKIWDTRVQSPRDRMLIRAARWQSAVAFQPGSLLVAAGGFEGKARLWDSDTGALVTEVGDPQIIVKGGEPEGNILSLSFDAKGEFLLIGTQEGGASVWQVATAKSTGLRVQCGEPCHSVAFLPNGKSFATPGPIGSIVVWDTGNGARIAEFAHPEGDVKDDKAKGVCALAIDPSGQTMVAGYGDGWVRCWNIESRRLERESNHHKGKILAVAYRPDGKAIVCASADSTATVEDAATGDLLGPPLSHVGPVNAVAWSPNGQTVQTGSADGTVQLWDAITGERIGPAFEHEKEVRGVAFRGDGRLIAACSLDATVRVWDVPSSFRGSHEQVRLWAQTTTGMELTSNGGLSILAPEIWNERRAQLRQLGGPPK